MDATNPCRQAFRDTLGPGRNRQSWDPIVVLAAVRGAAGVGAHKADQGGFNHVDDVGANTWSLANSSSTSRQSRLAWNGEYPWDGVRRTAGAEIDKLLCAS